MTVYFKMQQILLQNAIANLLQNATEVYHKMRQAFYYKMRQLLQIATILLQNATTFITNCDSTKRVNGQYIWKTSFWLYKLVIRTHFKHQIQYVTCYMQNSINFDKTLHYLTALTPMKPPFFSFLVSA